MEAVASGERARVERLAFRSARAQPGSGESREIDGSEGATRLEMARCAQRDGGRGDVVGKGVVVTRVRSTI